LPQSIQNQRPFEMRKSISKVS